VRSINILFLFGIRSNCLRIRGSRSQYLSIRMEIKQTVVIVGAYHCCQLCTTFYPTSCSQVELHMQRKLLETADHILCIRQIHEKKCEYNEALHQLFIDFKKAYDSVMREVLYNILIQFGIPMKLVRLTK